ncbi:MAG: ribosome biogenesis GTPase Der [Candidatus Rokubacteria bacterium]|nr:ribosome biogenesis GTPase Der [Candidatus Rokubacteria bacterium]
MVRPVIAIVGRPNVGKSTLFNRLVGRRQALVHDVPGVTRDRLYGSVSFGGWQATAVDTGGFDPATDHDLIQAVSRQVKLAIEESDLVLFVVDCRVGVTPLEHEIARVLRKSHRPVFVVANKAEGLAQESLLGEVYALGFPRVFPVSAEHGRGVAELLEAARQAAPVIAAQPEGEGPGERELKGRELWEKGLKVAVVGRPNVGKSALVNALLGSERVLVHEAPGTTRDAVDTPFSYRGRSYVLIDTAGIRRKGKVSAPLEKLAVVMALRSLERCQVAILLLDASEGLTAQDCHIGGYAHEAGRATVMAVNKWDLVPRGMVRRAEVVAQIRDRLPFLDYAPVAFTSAVTRLGLEELFDLADQVAEEAVKRIPPALVTKALAQAMERRPMSAKGIPLTLHSASQVGTAPPTFAVRVNLPDKIHFSYERYLASSLRQAFGFTGSPVRLLFRRAPMRRARRRR